MFASRTLRIFRLIQPTLIACGLVAATLPAAATEHRINCPRRVTDQYATLVFDLNQLDIPPSERESDGALELRFQMHVSVRQIDPARPGWVGAVLCQADAAWGQNVINLHILNQGFMRYPLNHQVLVHNVARHSIVEISLVVYEDDGGGGSGGNDYADISPVDGDAVLNVTLWPGDGTGQTPQASGNIRDLTFGRRKRVVGSGSSFIEDFRAAVEFTVSMSLAGGGVSGAIGGPPPPQVGGAIPNDSRGTGPTGPGQAITSREDRCRAYAESAYQQNLQAQQLHCGYGPPVWNSDRNAHYAWCMQANNVELTQAGWLMREAGLATCRQQNP